MQQTYETEIQKRKADLAEYSQRANILGIFKVIWVIVSCATLYQAWEVQFPLSLTILLLTEAAVFLMACVFHSKANDRAAYEAGLIAIANENTARLSGQWSSFEDVGEEFIDYEHEYAMDLDIVGKHSLFQYLNSSGSYYGRQKLAQDLLTPDYTQEDIRLRQRAIDELARNYALTSHIEYLLSNIGVDTSFPKLISELQSKKSFIQSKFLLLLLNVSRILTCSSILYAVLAVNDKSFAAATLMITLQLCIWGIGTLKTKTYLGIMRKLPYKIKTYSNAIEEIAHQDFSAEKLSEIRSILSSAQTAIQELAQIADHIGQCQNLIGCIVLNSLWLWDYKNSVDLDKWKQKYGDSADLWFKTLGELESLLSFSNLPRNLNQSCAPEISVKTGRVCAKSIGHPMLNNLQRVCNDIDLNNNIWIISGSNMSGKTTFMRTVGINMVLACAGSYVCAEQMTFSIMKVMTSMRIADELTEGISTFYAELKRIKVMIDAAKTDKHRLFLIDEIFRGTNSVDRQKGAEGVLKKLYALGLCGIITTHDLEVCKLEDAYQGIVNYSFYEHYTDGEIYFDYKMQTGISKTTNAEYLLKKVGIIE